MGFFSKNNSNNNSNNDITERQVVAKPLKAIYRYLLFKRHEKNYQERFDHFCSALNFLIDHRKDEHINTQTLVQELELVVARHEVNVAFFSTNRYAGHFENLQNNLENALKEVDAFVGSLAVDEVVSSNILAKIDLKNLTVMRPDALPHNFRY